MTTRRDVRHKPVDASLKVAADDLIAAAGGQKRAAGFCRATQQSLSEYAGAFTASFMPIDVVRDLELRTRGAAAWPQVTSELCRQLGGMFVPLPDIDFDGSAVTSLLLALSVELGATSGAVIDATSDRVWEAHEAREVRRKLAALIAVAMRMDAALELMAGGEA